MRRGPGQSGNGARRRSSSVMRNGQERRRESRDVLCYMCVKPDRALAVRIASSKDEAVATWRWFTVTSHCLSRRHQRIFPLSINAENHRHTEASSALAHAAASVRASRRRCVSIICEASFIAGA